MVELINFGGGKRTEIPSNTKRKTEEDHNGLRLSGEAKTRQEVVVAPIEDAMIWDGNFRIKGTSGSRSCPGTGTFSPTADRCDSQVQVPSYHITSHSSSKRPTCMAVDAGVSQVEYPSVRDINNNVGPSFSFPPTTCCFRCILAFHTLNCQTCHHPRAKSAL